MAPHQFVAGGSWYDIIEGKCVEVEPPGSVTTGSAKYEQVQATELQDTKRSKKGDTVDLTVDEPPSEQQVSGEAASSMEPASCASIVRQV